MLPRYGLFLIQLIVVCSGVLAAPATKPHIVFVFVDDWGYADVGFRNPAVKTPNFDMLAKTGLLLDRQYVFKYCSPSRVSFLTGRWPHHAHQWNPPSNAIIGANLKMTMLPAKLKQAGYATHMVGKWHEGLSEPGYLPINRGFDTSTGFLSGGEDHFTAKVGCAVDYWKNDAPDPRNGTYDAYNYRDDLTEIFKAHEPNTPMFLYLPLHNVHSPFEAPPEWMNLYDNTTCRVRHTMQAMVSVADNVTGHVVELMKSKGMWDNTIMVVMSDNGGAPCGGSNYPLRGSKGSFFEGGVRALAFANGGVIPENMRGKSTQGFIHVADWYTTFCKLAGVDSSDSGPGKFPVDGVDVWPIISGENSTSPHDHMMLGFNYSYSKTSTEVGAIIMGDYKLIIGKQGVNCDVNMWSPIDYPCTDGPVGENCDPYCLFNIIKDPGEHNNLADKEKDILNKLLDRYNEYSKEPREMQDQGCHGMGDGECPSDPMDTVCEYMQQHGGYWRPWRNLD